MAKLNRIIQTDEMYAAPGKETSDGVNRLELTHRLARTDRKVFGFIANILESGQMLNTET